MKIIDFKTETYFGGKALTLGAVLLLSALFIVMSEPFIALILFFLCIIIFTTHHRVKIDLQNKIFRDYIWILGLKSGDIKKFDNIEYIFINKNLSSQTTYFRMPLYMMSSSTITGEVYDAYLKFSEKQKVHLLTSHSKKNIVKSISQVAKNLNIMVIDYTDGEAQQVTIN